MLGTYYACPILVLVANMWRHTLLDTLTPDAYQLAQGMMWPDDSCVRSRGCCSNSSLSQASAADQAGNQVIRHCMAHYAHGHAGATAHQCLPTMVDVDVAEGQALRHASIVQTASQPIPYALC